MNWTDAILKVIDFIAAFKPTPEQHEANVSQRQINREVRYLRKNKDVNTYTYIRSKYPKWTEQQVTERMQLLTDLL